jgi:hypothetical protein
MRHSNLNKLCFIGRWIHYFPFPFGLPIWRFPDDIDLSLEDEWYGEDDMSDVDGLGDALGLWERSEPWSEGTFVSFSAEVGLPALPVIAEFTLTDWSWDGLMRELKVVPLTEDGNGAEIGRSAFDFASKGWTSEISSILIKKLVWVKKLP